MPELPIPVFRVQTEIEGIYQNGISVPPEKLHGRAIVAFAGIAKPQRFFAALESMGVEPVERIRFSDHHHYSSREIEKLPDGILVTTEKDAVRLQGLTGRPFCSLRISAKIPNFDDLMRLILKTA